MDRIDRILKHDLFIKCLEKNNAAEADRRFCRHNMGHLLDVARIAMILNLEEGLGIDREMIYASSLLHDIGRHEQYLNGVPHELAGGRIAPVILADCGFSEEETHVITGAILAHRDACSAQEKNLKGILYLADKASRPCFACAAEAECSHDRNKKNMTVVY